jgi:uncharacterized membrane protein
MTAITPVAREHESTRIEAFSDAMFAFAATLLVVSLEVPRDFGELQSNLRLFVPFALSFAALYFIWVAHTNVFRRFALGDPYTIVVNGILLFTVLFYVYPLKFTSMAIVSIFTGHRDITMDGSQVGTLFIIYGLGWSVVFLCIALLYSHANTKRDALGLTPIAAYDAITHSRHYFAFVAVGLISIVLAGLGIGLRYGIPGFAYALVGPLAAWNGSTRRQQRTRLAENVAGHPQLANTAAIRTKDIIEGLH